MKKQGACHSKKTSSKTSLLNLSGLTISSFLQSVLCHLTINSTHYLPVIQNSRGIGAIFKEWQCICNLTLIFKCNATYKFSDKFDFFYHHKILCLQLIEELMLNHVKTMRHFPINYVLIKTGLMIHILSWMQITVKVLYSAYIIFGWFGIFKYLAWIWFGV